MPTPVIMTEQNARRDMRTHHRIQQMLAWILIAALANPLAYAQVPPSGVGDFTLYTASASSGAYEPNILLLIDTSDSMNLPEGWREYPGAYDSHVEYLWNDINAISNAEVTTETDYKISTGNGYASGIPLPAPTKPLGFWGGASPDARRQIWQAARDYANGIEPGDPDKRSIYRNYMATDPNTGSALYWLPAGTAETDQRLWSNAFNRFLGADMLSRFGSVNGSNDPVFRGGINFGNRKSVV